MDSFTKQFKSSFVLIFPSFL